MIIRSDARHIPLKSSSLQCVVTSPPYWGLRDYGTPGQLGLERTPEEYVANMVEVFREVWLVLRDDGVLWLNLGDSYANERWGKGPSPPPTNTGNKAAVSCSRGGHGLKPKDIAGIPWRVAFALQADGWYLRSDIIWSKPNPMPESVRDRPTKAHEYIFMLTKSARYYWDKEAVREPHQPVSLARARRNRFGGKYDGADPKLHGALKSGNGYGPDGDPSIVCSPGGRNIRTVWTIATQPYSGSHFATFPRKLVETCILAGSKPGDVVFDPFVGSGTVVMTARDLGRVGIGSDLTYQDLSRERIYGPLFAETINA